MEIYFRKAVEIVLGFEGGYSNDPKDPGKETNFGISKRYNPDLDIKNLTREQAIEIYRNEYWIGSGSDKLEWPLNLVHFDTAVNCGIGKAMTILKLVSQDDSMPVTFQSTWYLICRMKYYMQLVEKDGTKKRFLVGWLNRSIRLMEIIYNLQN